MEAEPLLTWKGRRVRSPGDGPEAAARKVPEGPLRPGSLFFVPSPLEGWGLETLLDRLPAEAAVVVFEKDRELEEFCGPARRQWLGVRAGDARLLRLSDDTEPAVQELFTQLPLNLLRRCEFLPLNGAWLAHAARYREIFRRLEDGLKTHWSNRLTQLHLGPLWVKNLLHHLSVPRLPSSPWPDWHHDPVVVCGAGPTLDDALPWLRDHRRQVRILAADTALPVLRDAGIVPDAGVAVEAQHANLADFAGLRDSGLRLFADLTSLPAAARLTGAAPFWFLSEFAPAALFSDPAFPSVPRLPPLGSVGVVAAWIAWRLTRGPVVLAGLDFSFPPGRTHARGAPAHRALLSRTGRLAPASQGGTWLRAGLRLTPAQTLTSPVMEGYAAMLSDRASAEADRTFVWNEAGLPLGLEVWNRMTPKPSAAEAASHRPPTGGPDGALPGAAGWIEGRRRLWTSLAEEAARLRTVGAAGADPGWAAFAAAIASTDELLFTFPDPTPRPDADWLVRAEAQLRWALDHTRKLSPVGSKL